MVRVSYTDGGNFSQTVNSLPFGPIVEPAPQPALTLVSNTGQSSSATADITQQYAVGFRLGDHGQGYEISSVSIDLAAAPSRLTVSLWSARRVGTDDENTATKLFDFANPSSFKAGMNTFTAPAGAFAYQKVNYFIVLSGFGSKLSIKETSSDNEDAGTETGAIIYDKAAVRGLNATGVWVVSGSRDNVLRLSVEGSRRAGGILAATYAQPIIDDKGTSDTSDDTGNHQEIISVGDLIVLQRNPAGSGRPLPHPRCFIQHGQHNDRQRIHQPAGPALGFTDGIQAVQPDQFTQGRPACRYGRLGKGRPWSEAQSTSSTCLSGRMMAPKIHGDGMPSCPVYRAPLSMVKTRRRRRA